MIFLKIDYAICVDNPQPCVLSDVPAAAGGFFVVERCIHIGHLESVTRYHCSIGQQAFEY